MLDRYLSTFIGWQTGCAGKPEETQMPEITNILRFIVTAAGLVVILAPVVRVLLSARDRRGRTSGRGAGFRRWPGVLLITAVLVSVGVLLWKPLPLSLPQGTETLLVCIGFCIYLPAICLYLWGFLALGRQFGVSSVGGADLVAGHSLVRLGPYHFLRHPMYLAVLLAALGAFLVFLTWAMALFLPMSLVVIFRAAQDERLLEAGFGDAWRDYAREVPGWIPRFSRSGTSRGEPS
jgi:protein-S-isoprenylcysteine O-methyltransferase Ste14